MTVLFFSLLMNPRNSLLEFREEIPIDDAPNPSLYYSEATPSPSLSIAREHGAQAGSQSMTQNYTEHGQIVINSNADFAAQKAAENWAGDGTEDYPFIIEGYNITFNGKNIRIENVTAYFEIRYCLLASTISLPRVGDFDDGIAIYNSTNGRIVDNSILGNQDAGVYIYSSDIEVARNYFSYYTARGGSGIFFHESSGIASQNIMDDFWSAGIYLLASNNVYVDSNVISSGESGITIKSSENIHVSDNVLYSGPGIQIFTSERCNLINNEISYADAEGIILNGTSYSTIENNTVFRTDLIGIAVFNSWDCFYSANQISQCQTGMYIANGHSSIFSFNYIVANSYLGIQVYSGNENVFYGNLLRNQWNAADAGSNNQWDDGVSIGNYWSNDFGRDSILVAGNGGGMDMYPIEIYSTDVVMPSICSLPIIQVGSEDSANITWVAWSKSASSFLLYKNNTEIDAGVWDGSGSFQISLHNLSDGVHSYKLLIWQGVSFASCTAILRIPGCQLLNDFDGDEMYDLWEIENGFDPRDESDAGEDADTDQLTNLQEHDLGTNPYSSDSDGDAYSDLWEVLNGFNPLDPHVPLVQILVANIWLVIPVIGAVVGVPLLYRYRLYQEIRDLKRQLIDEKEERRRAVEELVEDTLAENRASVEPTLEDEP
jgi:parallel beta-helix repeat protein